MSPPAPSPRLIGLLEGQGSVLVLTGAGVSQESGIATFRDLGGLWEGVDPARVATPRAFAADPELVWRFYDTRRTRAAAALPNPAHFAVAALEATGRPFLLATQNVDGLHERAGSQSIVRLHGTLWRLRCTACSDEHEDLRPSLTPLPPICARCGGMLRPAVVWFEEPLPIPEFARAERACRSAELVLVVGTSSLVYPAATLPVTAREHGAYVVEINPERTPLSAAASEHLQGPAGVVLPALLAAARIPSVAPHERKRESPLAGCDRRRLGRHDPGRARRSRRAVSRRQARHCEPRTPRRAVDPKQSRAGRGLGCQDRCHRRGTPRRPSPRPYRPDAGSSRPDLRRHPKDHRRIADRAFREGPRAGHLSPSRRGRGRSAWNAAGRVHLHEAGAADAIADVVGVAAALHALGPDRIIVSPLTTGSGTVACAHGLYPVPGPATSLLLKGAPLSGIAADGERLTPTGAAILTSIAHEFGGPPAMTLTQVGHGAGSRDYPERPNVVRAMLGHRDAPRQDPEVVVVELTVDDATPQVLAHAVERIFAAGALDVYAAPVVMKKGRMGQTITALARPDRFDAVARAALTETTTLGLRFRRESRVELQRRTETVATSYGKIRIKIGALEGAEIHATPEYDDCAAAAAKHRVPLLTVQEAALAARRATAKTRR